MDGIASGLDIIFKGFILFFVVAVILGFYSIYVTFIKDNNTFETKTKPEITWKLEAKGQTVDTIWIYNFKN